MKKKLYIDCGETDIMTEAHSYSSMTLCFEVCKQKSNAILFVIYQWGYGYYNQQKWLIKNIAHIPKTIGCDSNFWTYRKHW